MKPWEEYQESGPWDEYADVPANIAAQSGQAHDLGEAVLTNLPTSGMGQAVARGLPATAGAISGAAAGALLGTPLGPLGIAAGGVLGAGLGGMSGEAMRQAAAQGTAVAFPEEGYPISTPKQVLKDVGIAGAAQSFGQGLGAVTGVISKALRPSAIKVGAQAIRVASGIPTKAGEAVLSKPSILLDAPTPKAAGDAYKIFESYTGMTGLGGMVKMAGRFPSESELEKMLFETARKASNGTAQPQELYWASQSASSLKQMGKLGNPRYAMLEAAISEAKNTVDDTLEVILPEYKSLRGDYAASKAAEEFGNILPRNKNLSPNVLRPTMAAAGAAAGALGGNPMALLGLPLISPVTYGLAIKGAALAGKIPAGTYRAAAQTGAGSTGVLAQEYQRRRP